MCVAPCRATHDTLVVPIHTPPSIPTLQQAAAQQHPRPSQPLTPLPPSQHPHTLRYVAITQVVLFSGWKAGALLSLSAYVMAMLAALASMGSSTATSCESGVPRTGAEQRRAGGQQVQGDLPQQQAAAGTSQVGALTLFCAASHCTAPRPLLPQLNSYFDP